MAYKSIPFRTEVQRKQTQGLPALLVVWLALSISVGIAAAAEDRTQVSSRPRIPRKKSKVVVTGREYVLYISCEKDER